MDIQSSLRFGICFTIVLFPCMYCYHGQFGYKLEVGRSERILHPVSIDQCYKGCLARGWCQSYTYHVRSQVCALSQTDDTTEDATLVQLTGYVYGKKADWPQKELVTGCTDQCMTNETCVEKAAGSGCKMLECGHPPNLALTSKILGNMLTIGSKVMYTCLAEQSICLGTGQWSLQSGQCSPGNQSWVLLQVPVSIKNNILSAEVSSSLPLDDGNTRLKLIMGKIRAGFMYAEAVFFAAFDESKLFRIHAVANNKYWHEDGTYNGVISSIWQPSDRFVLFGFISHGDGFYKIKIRNLYVCDGYNVEGSDTPYLRSNSYTDAQSCLFLVTTASADSIRIQTKSTGRYVRLDPGDNFISTRSNIQDDYSKFTLEEVSSY